MLDDTTKHTIKTTATSIDILETIREQRKDVGFAGVNSTVPVLVELDVCLNVLDLCRLEASPN